MKPTLVILAAGLGSRYGGPKQLEAVGPGGATIMEYSIYDAWRAGFGQVVLVVHPDTEATLRTTLGPRLAARIPVEYVQQRIEALPAGFAVPPGRSKPWGTGHAVLSAAAVVHEPFAVVNADDFYGAGSFAVLGEFLRAQQPSGTPVFAMVSYVLRDTLPESGPVARAVCRCTPDGWLLHIAELTGIERRGSQVCCVDGRGETRMLRGDERVSMNLWGFTPAIFDELRAGFERFLRDEEHLGQSEFYLPAAVADAVEAGRARVRVLPSADAWCGVTHPHDRVRAAEMLERLTANGVYPCELWG